MTIEHTKNDNIEHPKHYMSHPSGIECIQITRHMGFSLGNAIKYIWRADLKNDAIEDLKKAVWYLRGEIKKRENSPREAIDNTMKGAEAGIEYIEPPARWLPIESAPEDGTKVVLLTPTGDMLSPCEFVGETAMSETRAWLWWHFGPEGFTEVKNPTHYMILPKLPEEIK